MRRSLPIRTPVRVAPMAADPVDPAAVVVAEGLVLRQAVAVVVVAVAAAVAEWVAVVDAAAAVAEAVPAGVAAAMPAARSTA